MPDAITLSTLNEGATSFYSPETQHSKACGFEMDSSAQSGGPSTPSGNSYDYSRVPPEVWREILYRIDDPHTFQNSSKTCREWRDLLYKERAKQLFALVLPHIKDYISSQDIFSCRRVCKLWKSGVENYLPLNPSWKNVDCSAFKINPDKQYWVSPLGNTFYTVSQLTEFLTQMENCRGNPFPTRTLLFYYLRYPKPSEAGAQLEVQDRDELFTALRLLLRKFGDQIWTFVYLTDHQDHPPLQAWLQRLFNLLPNLKKLRLEVHGGDNWGLQVFNEGWSWFNHLNPFPAKLISLHVGPYFCCKVTGSILKVVGNQLQYLTCEGSAIEESTYFGSPTLPHFVREMASLREFNVTRIHERMGQCESQLLERLSRLHLPKLSKFFYATDQHFWKPLSSRVILRLFTQYAPEIEELYIPFPRERINVNEMIQEENQEQVAVVLPKLKTLSIGYAMVDYPSLGSLLDRCPALETVKLYEFEPGWSWDVEVFVPSHYNLQNILKLNGMIKSTKFKKIQLCNGEEAGKCVYTWRRN